MEKFIPYEKLSKKEQQKINKARRGTWGELNPVTRKPQNSKAYNRKRAQAWKKDFPDLRSFFMGFSLIFFHFYSRIINSVSAVGLGAFVSTTF